MGFDLCAFLGRASDMRRWSAQLPSAVVCELSRDLGMVPVTGALFAELRHRLGREAADRLDATRPYATWPSRSQVEAARRWAAEASAISPVAYVSLGEFGDLGYDQAAVWVEGRQVVATDLQGALACLRELGVELDPSAVNLERHRGETAAEAWAAEARRSG